MYLEDLVDLKVPVDPCFLDLEVLKNPVDLVVLKSPEVQFDQILVDLEILEGQLN
jgi:hypothetical protein